MSQGYTVTIMQCSYWATVNLTSAALFDSRGAIARLATRAENYVGMRYLERLCLTIPENAIDSEIKQFTRYYANFSPWSYVLFQYKREVLAL